MQAIVGDGEIRNFSVSAPCPQCGTLVKSTDSTREHLEDGRLMVRPADPIPDFDLDPMAPGPKDATECVFCGTRLRRSVRSSEHVLPKWLREVRVLRQNPCILKDAGKRRWTVDPPEFVAGGSIAVIPAPRKLRTKNSAPLTITVRVCQPCNHRWMSRLETAVRPILEPLINGETPTISGANRSIVSRWVTKTAITFEQDDPPTVTIRGPQIRDVRNGRPARWCAIWVARWAAADDILLRHEVLRGLDRGSMQVAAQWGRTYIGLGEGIAFMVISAMSPTRDFSILDPGPPWRQLWPGPVEDLTLAPETLTRDDIELLSARIIQTGPHGTHGSGATVNP